MYQKCHQRLFFTHTRSCSYFDNDDFKKIYYPSILLLLLWGWGCLSAAGARQYIHIMYICYSQAHIYPQHIYILTKDSGEQWNTIFSLSIAPFFCFYEYFNDPQKRRHRLVLFHCSSFIIIITICAYLLCIVEWNRLICK